MPYKINNKNTHSTLNANQGAIFMRKIPQMQNKNKKSEEKEVKNYVKDI